MFGQFYHIYNRGTNRENIFVEDRNYHHFLKLYIKHVPTRLKRDEVLAWFQGREQFLVAHADPADEGLIAQLVLDDSDWGG